MHYFLSEEAFMQTALGACYFDRKQLKVITLFGYCSKGVPGLQLVGVGKNSQYLKEKMVYLSRMQKIKFPLKRFVICLDNCTQEATLENIQWLEFPLLIMYWSLAGKIPIHCLSDCLTIGKVDLEGRVHQPSLLDEDFFEKIKFIMGDKKKLIHYGDRNTGELKYINARGLLGEYSQVLFPIS
mgnify:CR=1 FL=1